MREVVALHDTGHQFLLQRMHMPEDEGHHCIASRWITYGMGREFCLYCIRDLRHFGHPGH